MSFTHADDAMPATEGEVLELDPPHRFVFAWGDSVIRIELDPAGGGGACLLRFTHLLEEREAAARDAAGWHVCLDRLERHLASGEATAPSAEPKYEWRGHYDEHRRRGVPAGAPVPGD
jgi:uncharacterized protein YndB with AHSA1/START domain